MCPLISVPVIFITFRGDAVGRVERRRVQRTTGTVVQLGAAGHVGAVKVASLLPAASGPLRLSNEGRSVTWHARILQDGKRALKEY